MSVAIYTAPDGTVLDVDWSAHTPDVVGLPYVFVYTLDGIVGGSFDIGGLSFETLPGIQRWKLKIGAAGGLTVDNDAPEPVGE